MTLGNDEEKLIDDTETDLDEMEVLPELSVEAPVQGSGYRTLDDEEQSGGNDTDLKATFRRLFPEYNQRDLEEINETAKAIMVSDMSPDEYMEIMDLTITSIIENHAMDGIENDKKPIDVMLIVNIVHSICSIALHRKGRVEIVRVYSNYEDKTQEDKRTALRMMGS